MDLMQNTTDPEWDKVTAIDDVQDDCERPRKKRRKYIARAWFAHTPDCLRRIGILADSISIVMNANGVKLSVAVGLLVHVARVARSLASILRTARQSKRPSSKMHGTCSLQDMNSQATDFE